MKRGWMGFGILIGFFILGIVVMTAMNKSHLPTVELLDQAAEKTLAGDFQEGIALGRAAKQRWDRGWNGTAAVADHSPMDDVDALFAEMEIYAKTGEQPHFAACCAELSQRLEAMAGAHQFSWHNVL